MAARAPRGLDHGAGRRAARRFRSASVRRTVGSPGSGADRRARPRRAGAGHPVRRFGRRKSARAPGPGERRAARGSPPGRRRLPGTGWEQGSRDRRPACRPGARPEFLRQLSRGRDAQRPHADAAAGGRERTPADRPGMSRQGAGHLRARRGAARDLGRRRPLRIRGSGTGALRRGRPGALGREAALMDLRMPHRGGGSQGARPLRRSRRLRGRLGAQVTHSLKLTMVTPAPPLSEGALANASTWGWRPRRSAIARFRRPEPTPCTRRTGLSPARYTSSRYLSTRARASSTVRPRRWISEGASPPGTRRRVTPGGRRGPFSSGAPPGRSGRQSARATVILLPQTTTTARSPRTESTVPRTPSPAITTYVPGATTTPARAAGSAPVAWRIRARAWLRSPAAAFISCRRSARARFRSLIVAR